MKHLIGNWKSHKTFEQTYQWFDAFAKEYRWLPDLQVAVAVPFPFLHEATKKVEELELKNVAVAAQDISPYPFGAYTGAVTAKMIKPYADFCIVGHSERRNYFAESHLEIANKVEQLLDSDITPVLCLDEPYAQKQLAAFGDEVIKKLILAYEPLEAIGTGDPADPNHVAVIARELRQMVNNDQTPIIYGGSTNENNASTYLKIEGVSGLLPGGSSLDAHVFAQMGYAFQ